MKKNLIITFIFISFFILPAGLYSTGKKLVILFTHDLHSYFLPQTLPLGNGGTVSVGGYARLSSMIRAEKVRYGENVIVLDGGDFSMGTLFHTLFTSEAADLRMLGKLGYDATTLGNHEFDFRSDGLAEMLNVATRREMHLPEILSANITFSADCALEKVFKAYPVKPYIILERNGIRIGLFGIMGKDAADDIPFGKPAVFGDPVESAKKTVRVLREKEKADVIICLSHSGTSPVRKHSEDEILAEKVPDIDVIISGHTHTLLEKPIISGKTVIGSALSYGNYLGRIELDVSGKNIALVSYRAERVTKEIPEDPAITSAIGQFKNLVEKEYLNRYGYRYEQAVAQSDYNLETLAYLAAHDSETGLGDLITDAYRYAVRKAEGTNSEFVSMSIEPNGHIRDSFIRGMIRIPDIFQVLSLGMGPDGIPGYPLVAFYITGKELKNILEVHASVAPIKPDAALQVSGVRFTYNPSRIIFDRVTGVQVEDKSGALKNLDLKKLYRVTMNYYSANMVEYVGKLTFGLLTMVPKDGNGKKLPGVASALVDADTLTPGTQELKEWEALAMYLGSSGNAGGGMLPKIPARYQKISGRIVSAPSGKSADIYSNPGFTTGAVIAFRVVIPVVIALVVVLTVVLIIKRKTPIKKKGKIKRKK